MNKKQAKGFLKVGIFGILFGFFWDILSQYLNGFSSFFTFDTELVSFIILALITILLIVILSYGICIKRKIKAENFSNEEDSVYARHEKKLSLMLCLSTFSLMVLLCVVGYNFNTFQNQLITNLSDTLIFISTFLIPLILGSISETYYINIIKSVQPEKNDEVEKIDFNQRYLKTLDEGELKKAGSAALKTLSVKPLIYGSFFVLGIVFGMDKDFYLGLFGFAIIDHIIYSINSYKAK